MTDVERQEDMNPVQFWRGQLDLAEREERIFREDGDVIIRKYRGLDLSDYQQTEHSPISKFNVLWSNTETLKPAVYSQVPKPDVRVRNLPMDRDDPEQVIRAKIAQEAATVLEKALEVSIDDGIFDEHMTQARDDVLLPGRGLVRCRYVVEWEEVTPSPIFATGADRFNEEEPIIIGYQYEGEPIDVERDDEGEVRRDDAGMPIARRKKSEEVKAEYVFWKSFRMQPARTWADTNWVAFEHFMDREELDEAFGSQKAKDIPLNARRRTGTGESNYAIDDEDKPPDGGYKVARVWEIYDRKTLKRLWIADGYESVIDEEDDPMELEKFYPIAKPLTFYTTTDRTVPMAEYRFYKDQAIELDIVNGRITRLTALLKATGLYDAAKGQPITDMHTQWDGQLGPVQLSDEIRAQGGIQNSIWWWPIEVIGTVIQGLVQQRILLLQQIYELTGISDLIRGHTRATETLGAQELKANFGSMRMTDRTKPMQVFVRDTLRIMGELIGENFEKETLEAMTGMRISDAAMALLREDHLRYFNIDIETDSTVTPDATMEKQEAAEFARAIAEFFNAMLPVAQQAPQMTPFILDLFKVTFRRFKMSREIETQIDDMVAMAKSQVGQAPQLGSPPGVPAGAPNVVQMQ